MINIFPTLAQMPMIIAQSYNSNTMTRAYQCLGKDGFRIPSNGKIRRPISMTLFETLFYYFTCFDKTSVSNLEMKKGVVELLQDEEYLRSLQHSVDSSVNVKKRFGKVKEKYKEIINRW